jgi:hypothetical protein
MRARLTQTSFEPGASLNLRAVLTEYDLPVDRRAMVRAELVRPDLSAAIVVLNEVEPGIFEASVPANSTGVYQFRVRAVGATLRGQAFTREQGLTGAVYQGGDNPPPTSTRDPEGNPTDGKNCCTRLIWLLWVLAVLLLIIILILLFRR